MKKHIIIAGAPRAGKSTIAQRIALSFGYQHLSMDAVLAGIERVFPGFDTNAETQSNVELISEKIAPFIRAMMDSGEYDECSYGMVIDVFQLLPKDFIQYIDRSICDIFYFITSDVSTGERFEILKSNDTPADYTYFNSDDENRRKCEHIVAISELMKAQCLSFGLPFFETAHDREHIFQDFLHSLEP